MAKMRSLLLTMILFVVIGDARAAEIDRLYVIDCGWAHAVDQSLWSPSPSTSRTIAISFITPAKAICSGTRGSPTVSPRFPTVSMCKRLARHGTAPKRW